jgi:aldehyde dehydrogenase (NAD+)
MAQLIEHKKILVDGQWVKSTGTDVITVINPTTEAPIATVPRGTAEDVDGAARAAAKAFPTWSQTTIEERVKIFGRLARLTESRADEITRTIVSEVGQPITSATKSQTIGAVEELDLMSTCLNEIIWK